VRTKYIKFREWVSLKKEDTGTSNTDIDNLKMAQLLPSVAAKTGTDPRAAQQAAEIIKKYPKIPVDQAPDLLKATQKLPGKKVMKK
jgi:hypothetical protein